MEGNGVLGVLSEARFKWERRAPLTPAHCARLLRSERGGGRERASQAIARIVVQPCSKRVHTDLQYQEVGCEVSEDLSECGLIIGVKQPPVGSLLPDRAYAFFSHTHKGQPDNMPLLDEVLAKGVTLYDYELIVGEEGKRIVAFGEYAGRAGMIDFLRGLGERFLCLGLSTPFLTVGSAYMYPSLSAAKAAVLAVGDEIAAVGLPDAICPLVFVFTGSGKVSQGAQEIFRLLPHRFVDPEDLPGLQNFALGSGSGELAGRGAGLGRPGFQVYGCVVGPQHMVTRVDPTAPFDKAEYYAHPELYRPVFHETIAPFSSVIVNCIYWERMYPRLLSNAQLRELATQSLTRGTPMRLLGVADITCDVGGSIECLDRRTQMERPFFRYDPIAGTHHDDMDGPGVIFLAVDILPTELAKEATKHFGDALSPFLAELAFAKSPLDAPGPLRRACVTHRGQLAPLYEYIHRMRGANPAATGGDRLGKLTRNGRKFTTLVSLDGHLFDQFLINEALDLIEAAGGSFHLASCKLGQNSDATSYAELEVAADSAEVLASIVESLAAMAGHEASPQLGDGSHGGSGAQPVPRRPCPQRSTPQLLTIGSPPFADEGKPSRAAKQALTPGGQPSTCPAETNGSETTSGGGHKAGSGGDDVITGESPPAAASQKAPEGEARVWGSAPGERGQLARVLVLGAGRMCEPLVCHLARYGTGAWPGGGLEESLERSAGLAEVREGGAGERTVRERGARVDRGLRGEMVWVTVASLVLEEAQRATAGIPRCRAMQLDSSDPARLHSLVAQSDVVVSMLPPFCHVAVAEACILHKKHLVTASYVSADMAALHSRAEEAGVVLLCEMGLDPGIDHMSAMKMIDAIHGRGGRVRSFVSMCGGLPAPAAATNPLGYKFSWNPRGAILAGRNPAVYRQNGELIKVAGPDLFASAVPVRLAHLPAFSLERLPNRDSLAYADLYNIAEEAETVFRATLRYQGFSAIMEYLGELDFFNPDPHPLLISTDSPTISAPSSPGTPSNGPDSSRPHSSGPDGAQIDSAHLPLPRGWDGQDRTQASSTSTDGSDRPSQRPICRRPTYGEFLMALANGQDSPEPKGSSDAASDRGLGFEADCLTAVRFRLSKIKRLRGEDVNPSALETTVECLRFLGLASNEAVPAGSHSALDVLCGRMEARLQFAVEEQDMVLLHHEVEAVFPDGGATERHLCTLLAFGGGSSPSPGIGRETEGVSSAASPTAMARTVGLPAAIGAQLLLSGRIKARGVVRPLAAEVYEPALAVLAALGVRCEERME